MDLAVSCLVDDVDVGSECFFEDNRVVVVDVADVTVDREFQYWDVGDGDGGEPDRPLFSVKEAVAKRFVRCMNLSDPTRPMNGLRF